MNNENENAYFVSTTLDTVTIVLGVLAGIALIACNVFIFTMTIDNANAWIKPTIGIIFNFIWISNFYRWIVAPLRGE